MVNWCSVWSEQAGRIARRAIDSQENKINLRDLKTIGYPFKTTSFFIKGMFDLSSLEALRVGFESSKAGLCTKKDPLSSEDGAG
jgi:hypothetical protein